MRDPELQRLLSARGATTRVAEALGISTHAVSQWKDVPKNRVGLVARVLGVDPAVFRCVAKSVEDEGATITQPGLAEAQSPLLPEAKALGIDVAKVTEAALRKAISDEKARRWNEEHREAIAAHARWVEEHGLPLDEYRMF